MNNISMPLVSVIIPVYNGAAFLATAVASVLAQTYQPLEIIVIDDGSTDESAQVARQFGDQVRYLHQSNQGPAAARNRGVALATGDLIAFLDHDDCWLPDKLQQQVRYLQQNPAAGYVLTRMQSMVEPGVSWPAALDHAHYAQAPVAVLPSALLVRRTLFAQVGLFDPTLPQAEDVDWFARAQDLGVQKGVVDAILLYKRIHAANLSLQAQQNTPHLLQALRRSIQRKERDQNRVTE